VIALLGTGVRLAPELVFDSAGIRNDGRQMALPVLAREEMRHVDCPAFVQTTGSGDPALDPQPVALRPLADLPAVELQDPMDLLSVYRHRGLPAHGGHDHAQPHDLLG